MKLLQATGYIYTQYKYFIEVLVYVVCKEWVDVHIVVNVQGVVSSLGTRRPLGAHLGRSQGNDAR